MISKEFPNFKALASAILLKLKKLRVPTDQNVADNTSRDNKTTDLTQNSRWLSGTSFLQKEKDNWPIVMTQQ